MNQSRNFVTVDQAESDIGGFTLSQVMRIRKKATFLAFSTLLLSSCETRDELDASVNNLITSIDRASEDVLYHGARVNSLYERIENLNSPVSVERCRLCLSADSLQPRNRLRLGNITKNLERAAESEESELASAKLRLSKLCRQLIDEAKEIENRFGVKTSIPNAC